MTKTAARTFRFGAVPLTRTFRFNLARHDVRSTLPAAIQAIMQPFMLERTFEDALLPDFLYPALATQRPWSANLGDTRTFTRPGLLAPVTTPITGSDPSPQTYGFEQFSMTMDQYGNAVDTNMLQSAMTLSSKFLEDIQTLGVNAGQSLNRIARGKLYAAYGSGTTWVVTAQGSASTTCVVKDATNFDKVLSNATFVPVSGGTPLAVTVNGVANTVVACNLGTNTLTLGTAVTQAVGDTVLATASPYSLRPNAKASRYNLAGSDTATAAVFRAAVARLRKMNVPTINGAYPAHIDPDTEAQLFADADFKQAYQGRADSAVFRDMSLGVFLGIDWVRNNEAPTTSDGGSSANLLVHRPIVMGADALISGPFEGMQDLLMGTGVDNVPYIRFIGPAEGAQVAVIVRPPQDRLQQTISTAWSWVGDFSAPTDITTGDGAKYKRAVVIEHT
jgi:hypothetical protein